MLKSFDWSKNLKSLGEFANPNSFRDPINIEGIDAKTLSKWYRDMLLIRRAEEAIASLVEAKLAKCPCHLGIGQEAVAVGVSNSLLPTDKIFGAHRSHSHFLALGGELDGLMSEVLGKVDGCSKGMGGSMHLFDDSIGFCGSVPIVGATIPIAAGAALAIKMSKKNSLAVSYFGDGATEEGVFHETLNIAATFKLPILFVCENNLFSSHLDIGLRQPNDMVSRFAVSHDMDSIVVDGNDVGAVASCSQSLIEKIRAGGGPAFIECVTYRWRGHVGPNEDIDVGVRRKPEDLISWKNRDPISRLRLAILNNKMGDIKDLTDIENEIELKIKASLERANRAPYPSDENLLGMVYPR